MGTRDYITANDTTVELFIRGGNAQRWGGGVGWDVQFHCLDQTTYVEVFGPKRAWTVAVVPANKAKLENQPPPGCGQKISLAALLHQFDDVNPSYAIKTMLPNCNAFLLNSLSFLKESSKKTAQDKKKKWMSQSHRPRCASA